jgi:hypothetical protein
LREEKDLGVLARRDTLSRGGREFQREGPVMQKALFLASAVRALGMKTS